MRKLFAVIILFTFTISSLFAVAPGFVVYDPSSFAQQYLQLIDSGNQVVTAAEHLKEAYDTAERVYKGFIETYEDSNGNVFELAKYSLGAGSYSLKNATEFSKVFGAKVNDHQQKWIDGSSEALIRVRNLTANIKNGIDYGVYLPSASDISMVKKTVNNFLEENHNNYKQLVSEVEKKKSDLLKEASNLIAQNSKSSEALTENTNEQKQIQNIQLAVQILDNDINNLEKTQKENIKGFLEELQKEDLKIGLLMSIQDDIKETEKIQKRIDEREKRLKEEGWY